jgi:hypothetical protein
VFVEDLLLISPHRALQITKINGRVDPERFLVGLGLAIDITQMLRGRQAPASASSFRGSLVLPLPLLHYGNASVTIKPSGMRHHPLGIHFGVRPH